ncbi:hypothetical protein K9N68_20600 [Kovacikia minuta CCNUW1]|uniref:hypothetical protein n=1 Tax=Kovacikia minuta TaxID=2931930 RepID=UPI001CCD1848|nr:hypothetical protein [Kovacikia minuta]UBF24114.1 hypothetical protein K9N68_20600 [Kovacikia minuta CCNUW1]
MGKIICLFQQFYQLIPSKTGVVLLLAILAGCTSNANTPLVQKSSDSAPEKASLTSDRLSINQLVSSQYPEIKNPQISDWQKANILRRWAYKNIVNSTASCTLEKVLKPDFYKKTTAELYTAFKQDKGGVWCGGASIFSEKLYRDYGFNVYTVNMGKSGYLTHVVNLVEIQDKGQKKLVIEDASYNVTYTDLDGSPLDYFTFLKLLSQRKDNQIKTVKDNDGKRTLMLCKGDPFNIATLEFMKQKSSACVEVPNVGTKCNRRVVLEDLTRDHPLSSKTKQFLAKAGYKPDILYLYLYPFLINSEIAGLRKDLLDRAQAVIKSNTVARLGYRLDRTQALEQVFLAKQN